MKRKNTSIISQLFSVLKKISLLLALISMFLCWDTHAAFAHRPHDVVTHIEISPNYNRDRTVFVIVRKNLFKSTDKADSWERIVQGIDNKYGLSSLTLSENNSKILFLSSFGDGIYKSEDEGISWVKVNNGLNNLKIDRLAADPSSSDIVLAAGEEAGLYKTENGGDNWSLLPEIKNKVTVIGFAPNNRIFVGDRQGILSISEDGGKTWKQSSPIKNSGAITAIAISPEITSDSTFWIGTEKQNLWKTTNNGTAFEKANEGISGGAIQSIAISPDYAQDKLLFASTWDEAVFESNDGGQKWTQYNEGIVKDDQADVPKFSTPHFNELKISPAFSEDKTLLLGGFNGLSQSTDGSRTWKELETLARGTIIGLAISPDYQNDSTLAIATYVGNIYISNDKGETWKNITNGLEVPRFTKSFKKPNQDPRRFFDIAFSPNYRSDKTLFASVLWTDFLRSKNSGELWKIIPMNKSVRGVTIATSPDFDSDQTVYVGNQKGIIFRSTDGGSTFSVIGKTDRAQGNDAPSLVISPAFSSDRTLYLSSSKGVNKSVDSGKTWKAITAGKILEEKRDIQLAISPNYKVDNTVLASTEAGLFITKDAGENWSKLPGAAYGRDGYIEGVALSPNYQTDRTFLASVRGKGLFKTMDGGETFTKIGDDSILLAKMIGPPSAGIPIQFSPSYAEDNTIYGFGASSTEVFKSTDGGNTWKTIEVPKVDNNDYNFTTWVQLMLYVYRNKLIKLVAALFAALVAYLILGYSGLEKKLPLNKLQLKVIGAFVVFIGAFIVLFVI
ncbi:WD40/YVTN/BNR-like repeat-containing protein [Lusitaniella coriacea]|uniref:WD40/YVTN/BNR-like repeat-containing protein n=1 Tax=Lusitaniella coriacea TaxID=1983105 RepID=UPI003CED4294